jgi:hypothetical protein
VNYTRDVLTHSDIVSLVPQCNDFEMLVLSGEDDVSDNVQLLAAYVDGDARLPMTDGTVRLIEQLRSDSNRSAQPPVRSDSLEPVPNE